MLRAIVEVLVVMAAVGGAGLAFILAALVWLGRPKQ